MFASHSVALEIFMLLSIIAHIDHIHCQEGVIMTGPKDQTVALGEIVTFNCHARGNSVYWYINGHYADPQVFNEARGFTITNSEIPRPRNELEEHNNTITVEAHPSNNNTLITCTASGFIHGQQAFQEGRLIIAGPPLAPLVSLDMELMENESSLFTLSWTTPFSWSEFPVTGYTVILSNYSNGVPFNRSYTILMESNVTDSFLIQFNSTGNECYRLKFFVSANNSLGEGQPTIIHSGHPVIAGEIDDLETIVTFLSNGTPHFWMSFPAPRICPGYQIGTYNITIYSNESDNVTLLHQFGPIEYTQENENERTLVVKEVKDGFIFGGHYDVSVSAESLGIIRSKSGVFDAVFDHDSCKPTIDDAKGDSQQIEIVIITTAIVSLLLIGSLLVIIAALLYLLKQQRRKGDDIDGQGICTQAARSRTRMETCNPIYEGALYETTPGESLTCLISPASTPDSTHHYIKQPPSLPPPRGQSATEPMDEIDAIKASMKQAAEWPESETGDVYVVMGPNSTTPKVNHKDIRKDSAPNQLKSANEGRF